MADKGWIKLYRQVQDCWIWNDKPYNYGAAWVDMLLMANHKDKKIMFDKKPTTVKSGTFITSSRKLAERWGWSRGKLKRFLDELESDQMIIQNVTTKRTTISIVNYGVFQETQTTDSTTDSTTRSTTDGPVIEPLADTNKNDKELKNVKNERNNNNPPTPLKNKPESQRELFDRLCEGRNISGPLKECLHDWITYKSERKEVYKEQGMKSFISQMEKNESKYGSSALIDCIEQCMGRNYKGIITDLIVKDKTPKQPKGQMSDEEFINMWRNA